MAHVNRRTPAEPLQTSCETSRSAKKAYNGYVSIREIDPNCRYLALKCGVFRGRSRCSTNSNHCHRTSAG